MSDDTIRGWLETRLKPLLPDAWSFTPTMGMPETLSRITVAIKHMSIDPLAEAPRGHLDNEVVVTVADPHTDQAKAEVALDDQVLELVNALDGIEGLAFKGAKKVSVTDTYIGWDITCQIISKKKEV